MEPSITPPREEPKAPSKLPAIANPTVVGIGASAGSLDALKRFFEHVPADSGLTFVVVVHLSPEHKSQLAMVLQPYVRFPIEQVMETTLLEPNRAYVIPPNANISAVDTHLRLSQLEQNRGERAPIDYFFRTLAASHDGQAIAVILTGTGSDGTLGIKDIKANGGTVIVQDPNEAEYDGMPQSAIATGLADFVVPVAQMPDIILRLDRTQPRIYIPPEDHAVKQDEEALLQDIFALVRERTDRDFSRYKRSTVMRRIARRMQLHYIEDLKTYVERLRQEPDEVSALADDLLIVVTKFFRDPEVFAKVEKEVIPRLFENRRPNELVRAWSVGCATGEEAYSIAILLLEEASRHEAPPRLQIFASDLHGPSLEKARQGFFPGDFEADITPERLKKFFVNEKGGFRVRKDLRDLVVFAHHNLLADPPFSHIDLIFCRNLLIYLERDVQRAVVELFHYALNRDGFLVLGTAEAIDAADLFTPTDKEFRIYCKRNVPSSEPHLPVFPFTRTRLFGGRRLPEPALPPAILYSALHQRMLGLYAAPSILVGPDNSIVHLSEHAGRFLVHPGGDPTENVFKLVREELAVELRMLIDNARAKEKPSDSRPIAVDFNGTPRLVAMHVAPSTGMEQKGFVLVMFDEQEPRSAQAPVARPQTSTDIALASRVRELENELDASRERIASMVEQHESSEEEMKASNEEVQSANEELRATMEELETSKEELESVNQELQTVSQETRYKVEEFAQFANDLNNVLAAAGVAALFLDRDLRIVRFSPKISELFNVRTTDRGRPISDLTRRFGYPELLNDAQKALQDLTPVEHEVKSEDGRWFLTRMLPNRGADDRIEGIVITFVDVTRRANAEAALREAEKRAGAS